MIFVTVGHQMPFDRLIRAVDEWAAKSGRDDVIAQTGRGLYRPRHLQRQSFMSPQEFRSIMRDCSAIVGHAGTGTIIAAMQFRKPLLVMPRLSRLGETRNDHQVPTAQHFERAGHVMAAYDEDELIEKINAIERFQPNGDINGEASPELVRRLREFAFEEPVAPPQHWWRRLVRAR